MCFGRGSWISKTTQFWDLQSTSFWDLQTTRLWDLMNLRVVRNKTSGVFEHVEKTHEMPSGWCEHQPRSYSLNSPLFSIACHLVLIKLVILPRHDLHSTARGSFIPANKKWDEADVETGIIWEASPTSSQYNCEVFVLPQRSWTKIPPSLGCKKTPVNSETSY